MTELPPVLWGLRTTPNRSTDRTPFFLVYDAEAVLPSDWLHNAPRVELFSEAEAEQAREDAVGLLEEEHEMALIRLTIYQQDLQLAPTASTQLARPEELPMLRAELPPPDDVLEAMGMAKGKSKKRAAKTDGMATGSVARW